MKPATNMRPIDQAFAQIAAAIESFGNGKLNYIAGIFFSLAATLAAAGVNALDTAYTSWTLAGALAGTACALLWHPNGETTRVVAGRAIFAFASGCIIPRISTYFFPWLAEFTKDPLILLGVGMVSALVGFTIGHGVVRLLQKREEKVAREAVLRATGVDLKEAEK